MKQVRILRVLGFIILVMVTFWAPPGNTQAGIGPQSEPDSSAGILIFQYAMNDGSSGAGAYFLADNGVFVDNAGATGVWNFNPVNSRVFIRYDTGAHCGALSLATYFPANSQVYGSRACTDGSGIHGNWAGILWDYKVTRRVSVASDGAQANHNSWESVISPDGRYVAFDSSAGNLVSGDTNNRDDVFVHDLLTGQTARVSIASDGSEANEDGNDPAISADGRFVAFWSYATTLIKNDTNSASDVFVHDRLTGTTTRVSLASDGTPANGNSANPALSADGRYVAFRSLATNLANGVTVSGEIWNVFVHDRQTGQTTYVSMAFDGTPGDGDSSAPAISANGQYVAFQSWASNLVSGDTNSKADIFVHDLGTGQTSRPSIASDGAQGNNDSMHPSISASGRYVAFHSYANNLVSGDTNAAADVFVRDRLTAQTRRVSVAADGAQANNSSSIPAISPDGRYVAFDSSASNLVNGDTNGFWDVYVHDRLTGQTRRMSVASNGAEANEDARSSAISADGRYVAFHSEASNLVNGDTNGWYDIFVREPGQ